MAYEDKLNKIRKSRITLDTGNFRWIMESDDIKKLFCELNNRVIKLEKEIAEIKNNSTDTEKE